MSCHKAKTGQVACSDRREEIGNMFFFGKRYYPPPSSSSAFTLTFFLLFLFPQLFVNIYKMPRIEMTRWRPVKKKKNYLILQNSCSIFSLLTLLCQRKSRAAKMADLPNDDSEILFFFFQIC